MLLNLRNAVLNLGGPNILDDVNFQLSSGQRVALLGRNGSGKSTLLKVMAGELMLDDGKRETAQGISLGYLPQCLPEDAPRTVYELVARGFGESGRLLLKGKTGSLAADHYEALEQAGGWDIAHRIDKAISQLKLEPDMVLASLSGGGQRRALLASVIALDPDILLLDEPTNHLDLDSVIWLEEHLLARKGTLVFVSHDRAFISRLATRIIELDRGALHSYEVSYQDYLRLRELKEQEEARHQALFDKRLAEEERWIRQGIKARRTRNEGRVRALKKMREERQARRDKSGVARLQLDSGEKSGRLVVEAEGIGFGYGETPLITDFSTIVLRGDKVGLIGPNGAGKTTLLRLLLGELAPQAGKIKLGTRLEVAYLDQQRSEIDADKSLIDNVSLGREFIDAGGRSQHIISYLQQFLFSPQQARMAAGQLSGGERARLLLARLFSRPANVLVLDEPTNDLDMETLELLEELLLDYEGTLFLVSHDRALLNNVVTSSLVLEGDGKVAEYVGGYDDWLRQRPSPAAAPTAGKKATEKRPSQPSNKLSYKDQRELDALPERIAGLEAEQARLYALLADGNTHAQAPDKVREAKKALEGIESELNHAYQRWESLERLSPIER